MSQSALAENPEYLSDFIMDWITVFTRVAPNEIDELLSDGEEVLELVEDMGFDTDNMMAMLSLQGNDPAALYNLMEGRWSGELATFSLEQALHMLHFIFTGESDLTAPTKHPFSLVIQGGRSSNIHTDHAEIRVLSPSQVTQIHTAIKEIELPELQDIYSKKDISELTIHPHIRWGKDELQTIWDLYPALQVFFERAYETGDFVLVSLQ